MRIAAVDLQKKGDALKAQNDLQGRAMLMRANYVRLPSVSIPSQSLGETLARLGDYPGAIGRYREALAIDPKQESVRTNLGIAYYNRVT
jgi:tetratricopeptide (TPR) repeat protein